MDNQTLRTAYQERKYVIIAQRNGIRKYIARNYGHKHNFDFTVILNKAKRFDTEKEVKKFLENYGHELEGVEVKTIVLQMYLV